MENIFASSKQINKYFFNKTQKLIVMKKQLFTTAAALLIAANMFGQNWLTTGNSITGTEKLGTTNNKSLDIITNNSVRMKINNKGNIGVGTTTLGTYDRFTSRINVPAVVAGSYTTGINSEVIGNASPTNSNTGIGVYGKCINNNYYGYGGQFIGDYAGSYSLGIGYTSLSYGVLALAENVDGYAYGVYGGASSDANAYNYGVYGFSDQGWIYNVGVTGIQPYYAGAAGYFDGDLEYTGNLYDVSDAKFKSDVKDLTSALDKINMLSPKSYTLNQEQFKGLNFGKTSEFGFIAQEIEAIFPELVKDCVAPVNPYEMGKEPSLEPFKYKAVNYSGLIPVLTAAIQEQQVLIESQNSTITNQETEIADLKSTVEDLLKRVELIEARNATNIELGDNSMSWLGQNTPNPFGASTQIAYYIPEQSKTAKMIVSDINGKQITTTDIHVFGNGQVNIQSEKMASGNYVYSLVVDDVIVDSKQFSVTK